MLFVFPRRHEEKWRIRAVIGKDFIAIDEGELAWRGGCLIVFLVFYVQTWFWVVIFSLLSLHSWNNVFYCCWYFVKFFSRAIVAQLLATSFQKQISFFFSFFPLALTSKLIPMSLIPFQCFSLISLKQ